MNWACWRAQAQLKGAELLSPNQLLSFGKQALVVFCLKRKKKYEFSVKVPDKRMPFAFKLL